MTSDRPRLLDLFCGAGGAAVGYHRAGFDVVGVDIAPQPHYPFDYIQTSTDVILTHVELGGPFVEQYGPIDVIHASPPCQGYTTMSNRHGSTAPLFIDELRARLILIGLPYVIENVPGAKSHMRSPITLHGGMFGLGVNRPRLFESNVLLLVPQARRVANAAAVYGRREDRRLLWRRTDGSELHAASLTEAQEAMEMDWADWHGTKEAIPPAYTEFLGGQLIDHLVGAR